MSLSITFHRAASAEFIEASAWYETKRLGLALEFSASEKFEVSQCVGAAGHERPLSGSVKQERSLKLNYCDDDCNASTHFLPTRLDRNEL